MALLLYTAELDLAEADVEPFLNWYAHRHAPDLFSIGFRSCACYRTSGGDMNLFDAYEIPGHHVFTDPNYEGLSRRDRYARPILDKRRNKAHTIYEQTLLKQGAVEPAPPLDADGMVVVRFEMSGELEAARAELSGHLADWREAGVLRARLGIRTHDHPTYTTGRPRCILILECNRGVSECDVLASISGTTLASRSRIDLFSARRLYPWPTDP